MKLNGIGKAGIICLFVGSGISVVTCLLILVVGLAGMTFAPAAGGFITIFAVIAMVLPVLVIIFGALAIIKGNNSLKVACAILGLISIIFVWIAYLIPAILAIVGGVLTLCGKFEENKPNVIEDQRQTQIETV